MIISNAMNQNNKLTLSRTNTVVRIPEDIVGPQVSLFANVVSTIPVATVDLWTFLLTASYQNIVDEYRGTKDPDIRAKIKKFEIPCVTVAGAVSYTHLDVYKRQRVRRRPAHPGTARRCR